MSIPILTTEKHRPAPSAVAVLLRAVVILVVAVALVIVAAPVAYMLVG